jgi:hypothetical protein
MQVPFPELTNLELFLEGEMVPAVPDSFLGGSAPRLQSFQLSGIPFPGFPKLPSTANHLVRLWLEDIPHSGYISPKAMVALLCALSSLRTLCLEFRSSRSRPDRRSRTLPPPKRSILPALEELHFKGVVEYLNDLVTFIDAPQIETLFITFFSQIDSDTPPLAQLKFNMEFISNFINRTPTLGALDEAHVQFGDLRTGIALLTHSRFLEIAISGREPDRQLSSIAQVCNSSLHLPSTVEDLYIEHKSKLVWKINAIENTQWLQVFLPFTTVKNLYISEEFAPGIAVALQELVGDRITEVLPSLQNIFVERLEPSGQFQENIGQFVAARQFCDHPVAISQAFWDRDRV